MRVKICGITTPDDARMVAEAGADAIGLNFVGGPRRIDLTQAEAILAVLPPFVVPVALVEVTGPGVGELNEQILELLATRWVATVQVHGQVSAEAIGKLSWEGFRVILPVRVRDAEFAARPVFLPRDRQRGPAAVLLDTHDPEKAGGTGRSFCWDWVRQAREQGELADWPPIIVAGGLTPENVGQAIAVTGPYAVDVSSGVESAPGRKDPAKVARFIAEARRAVAGS